MFYWRLTQGLLLLSRRKMVHSDLKPDNIMIKVLDDGTFVPKIIDFGFTSKYN